jgi:5-methylcytosine-specific restriction endonuclease McrA
MLVDTSSHPTKDHVHPKRLGGTLENGNCLIVCTRCNDDKGGLTLHEFLERLKSQNDPRHDIVLTVWKRTTSAQGSFDID